MTARSTHRGSARPARWCWPARSPSRRSPSRFPPRAFARARRATPRRCSQPPGTRRLCSADLLERDPHDLVPVAGAVLGARARRVPDHAVLGDGVDTSPENRAERLLLRVAGIARLAALHVHRAPGGSRRASRSAPTRRHAGRPRPSARRARSPRLRDASEGRQIRERTDLDPRVGADLLDRFAERPEVAAVGGFSTTRSKPPRAREETMSATTRWKVYLRRRSYPGTPGDARSTRSGRSARRTRRACRRPGARDDLRAAHRLPAACAGRAARSPRTRRPPSRLRAPARP